jgi:hypothetical protein
LAKSGYSQFLTQYFERQLLGFVVTCDKIDDCYGPLLAISVDSTDPLFDSLRIPRQVVVHERFAKLKIQALCTCFSTNKYAGSLFEFVNKGKLLLIGFLRRMASSLPALAASLRKVADRMRATLEKTAPSSPTIDNPDRDFAEDLEGDIEEAPAVLDTPQKGNWRDKLRRELSEVEGFIKSADSIRIESKARALLDGIRTIQEQGRSETGTGKVVIFTESLTTQDAIRKLLIENGVSDQSITLFRGNNDSPRAMEALRAWESEIKLPLEQRPSREVAMRLQEVVRRG